MRDVRGEGQEKHLPPFSYMARRGEFRVLCVRRTPLYVGYWLRPSRSKLLPPEVTSTRVMFFGEKCLPPFLRVVALGWPSKRDFFIVEATRANFFLEKHLPPFLRAVVSGGCRMMYAEGSDRKMSPPLSGIRLLILSRFYGFAFLVTWCTWPKVFGFALIVR